MPVATRMPATREELASRMRMPRQRLAGIVPPAKEEGSTRQASGKVQASVEDRKQAAAATPDKLTLSKGAAAGTIETPEEKLSKERERQATDARVAELAKNVDQLKAITKRSAGPLASLLPFPRLLQPPRPPRHLRQRVLRRPSSRWRPLRFRHRRRRLPPIRPRPHPISSTAASRIRSAAASTRCASRLRTTRTWRKSTRR